MSFFKNLFNEVAASVKAAVSSFRKPKEGVPETSFDYRKPIMGALLRGEIDVARRLIKGENVKMMPRRIRDFAAAQLA
jgi:hypothetical protein